ncbi:putative uncharacterized protein DDB_G0282133 [Melanaphis sacchari]|uniref:putative uncharacterized protein DDB_G0282133 n=1 Tax=Melanaphis sacchari TaxID=742174 RepID=UPI000DC1504C|nr:putative uncharacterized protein DDB_G0282133 [Melanaphis sacchari]
MFTQSVFARKTMILAVAFIFSIATVAYSANAESVRMCIIQKNPIAEEHNINPLHNIYGETLITEWNEYIYVVSICCNVPEMFSDPRKMTGAIKLTADGKAIDLGHIDKSSVIVNENSIMLTYTSGDRDRYTEDTCKGFRWKTHVKFLCDPSVNQDVLTLIKEDPEHSEICQVWFEVKTSKTCNWHSNTPLTVSENDFSISENLVTKSEEWRTDYDKYNVRESTNFHNIPLNNEEIKNRNSIKITSKDQKNQFDNENYLNEYKKSLYEKSEMEKAKGGNLKINTPEDKMLIDHENNYNYSSNDLENKLNNSKINNLITVPVISLNNEYSYPGKNENILRYNNLKKYLNKNKNSESKNENLLITKLIKKDQNKNGKLNQNVSEIEKFLRQNTFENQTSNKEINDSEDNKIPSDNEKKFNQDYLKKSNLNNDTKNNTLNSYNGVLNSIINEGKIADTSNQSQSKDNTSIIYDDNKVPDDTITKNYVNQTYSQRTNLEPKSFQKVDSKTVMKNNNSNINNSMTPRKDSENKPIVSEDTVDTNHIYVTKQNASDDNTIIDANEKNKIKSNYNLTSGNDENAFVVTIQSTTNNPSNKNETSEVNGSSTESSSVNTSLNNIKMNNKSESNDTSINNIDNVNKNTQPDQLEPKSSAKLSDNITTIIIPSNKNETGEVNGSSTESSSVNTSLNNIKTNNKSESNDTSINNIDNVNKNTQPDQLEPESSAKLSNNITTTIIPSNKNETGEENGLSTESSVDRSLNNIKTDNTSASNDTSVNNIDNVNKNAQPDQLEPKSSTKLSDNITTIIIPSNKNETGEVNGSSTESSVDTSLNNIKTNNKSKSNDTSINNIDNVNKNIQPDQLEPESSENSSDNNNNNDNLNATTNSANQSENNFSFGDFFSNIFNDGIHVSAAKITGAVVVLLSGVGVVGTAINRYYYKKTGTDQIPFKGTFQSIINKIKVCCCCCCNFSGDDLEAQNSTSEKSPLLQPKNISSPLLVDETSQKSKKRSKRSDDEKQQKSDSADDDSSQQNSNKDYGSMKNVKKSSAFETKFWKRKRNSTIEDKSLVENVKEKLINVENNLQKKSIKEVMGEKINTLFTEKLKPTIKEIFGKFGKTVESSEEIKKNLDTISKDAAIISKLVKNEKSVKNVDDVNVEIKTENTNSQLNNGEKQILNIEQKNEKDVNNIIEINTNVDEVKSQNNSEKVPLNENEIHNAVVEENNSSITFDESQKSQNVKPIREITIPKVSVPDLQQIETNKQASDMKKASTLNEVTAEELIKNKYNGNTIFTKNNIEKLEDTIVTPLSETAAKINESKLKFLGIEKEDKSIQKVTTNNEKKGENEEDELVEVIEEVVYIDGSNGAEDEEIIEEIIETTTIEEEPDFLDESGSGHTKVTVRTTRKISSSSLPGEVTTTEETVVTDGIPENNRKLSGFELGIGKSGVSISDGDKKLEVGVPNLKLNRSKSKSPKNVGDSPDKRDTKSPEKSKRLISMPKIFKRSISQPSGDDIQEAESESQLGSTTTKKSPRPSAGLLIFGKSRSKSSMILDENDIKTNTGVVSDFIDNEQNASRISNEGLGEFDKAADNADVNTTVVVRKTSTTTSTGKDFSASTDTAGMSPTGLKLESAEAQQSSKNADTKSNTKSKREKKDKTKLTTLTRPF